MWRLICLSFIQSVFLIGSQVFLKLAMNRIDKFCWTWSFFKDQLLNWQLAISGVCIVFATMLWMYIIKHFAFSIAYPLISMSYVWGILVAVFLFHEDVPFIRWCGVGLIMVGVMLVMQK
jgi:EamA-like transporter family.